MPIYAFSILNSFAVTFEIRIESTIPTIKTTGRDHTGLHAISLSAYPSGISAIASE